MPNHIRYIVQRKQQDEWKDWCSTTNQIIATHYAKSQHKTSFTAWRVVKRMDRVVYYIQEQKA